MERSTDVQGPWYRKTESIKNSVLPSFSVQYTCRTQEGLTVKVTLQVHTARNGETKKKNRRGGNEKEVFSVQCQLVQQRTEKFAGTSQTFLLASTAQSLFHQHFLMQIFHRNNFRLLESRGLQTLFSCRNISSIQE